MTVITRVQALPFSPFNDTEYVGIVITSGVPSYFKITGVDLNNIVSFNWFPKNPGSVLFETRQLILIDSTEGTIMVRVLNNFLDDRDRGGRIAFRLIDGTNITFDTKTYGRISMTPLWTAPDQGLITG